MEVIKDEKILKIIDKLKECIKLTRFQGHVFVTGGAIRDSLLEKPINDLDIVVDLDHGGIMLANLFAAKERCYAINSNPVIYHTYGTAKVRLLKEFDLKNINIEFVETRKKQYKIGESCFGTLEEDAKRRDLTINSLYWNINDGKLYDYTGGINDMFNKTIKCPNPYAMFVENPIKMLRAIRFSAELGWGIEKNTWLAIIKNAHLIKKAPQELITSEISKILVSNNASIGVRKMLYSGLLEKTMPDIYELINGYESRDPMVTAFDHTMKVLDTVQPFIENRLAALFHDVANAVTEGYRRSISKDAFNAEIASSDLKNMKFSNAVINSVENSIKYHRFFDIYGDGVVPPDKKIRKFASLCGENIGAVVDLMNANNLHRTYNKKKSQVIDIISRMEEMDELEKEKDIKLPITGSDIISLGVRGRTVGRILNKIKDAYFENPKITKEECLEIAKHEVEVLTV